ARPGRTWSHASSSGGSSTRATTMRRALQAARLAAPGRSSRVGSAVTWPRGRVRALLADRVPAKLSRIEFEVDVAAQESRAFNPITETADILLYDPLEDRYQQSRVLDLFRRLPVRMTLFRIFAQDTAHSRELIKAANEVLGTTT